MKKVMFSVLALISILGLLANVVFAEEVAFPSKPAVAIANNGSTVEPGTVLTEVSSRDFSSSLPYVLQQDYKVCLDQCTQDHSSCMSKAGGNPTAENQCDEMQWRCTRGCEDKFYGLNPIDSLNRY